MTADARTTRAKRLDLCIFPLPEAVTCDDGWPHDFNRVSGRCVCEVCGLHYDDHPTLWPDKCPTLVVLCRGEAVKT